MCFEKGFNDTVVNLTCYAVNGGIVETTFTVPELIENLKDADCAAANYEKVTIIVNQLLRPGIRYPALVLFKSFQPPVLNLYSLYDIYISYQSIFVKIKLVCCIRN